MKKVSLLSLLALSFLSTKVEAQHRDRSETTQNIVNIDVLKDEPESVDMWKIEIPLLNANLSNINLSAYDIRPAVSFLKAQKFFVNVAYTYSIADKLAPDVMFTNNRDGAISVYDDIKANEFHIEGTYFLYNKTRTKDIRVRLKGGQIEHITYVPAQQLISIGPRIGFAKGITWYGVDDTYLTGTDKQGTTRIFDFPTSTYMQYSHLRLGVSYSKTENLHLMAEGYGYRNSTGIVSYYLDALIATNMKFDDVYAGYYYDGMNGANTMYVRRYEIDSKINRQKIGAALGARYTPFINGSSYFGELGILPGIKEEKNFYFKVGWNIAIGTNVKMKNLAKG